MSAAATDKFKKLSKRWVGQIGSGGVADGTTGTIPLASVTNLPTDTAVVAVVDRVDADGTATPNLEETVIGVVSGSNLTSSVRGAEGTAQAHDAGAVVEILVTAKGYNDIIDGILVGHTQSGAHILDTDGTLASNSDTKIASQKATKTYVDTAIAANSINADGWTSSADTWVYASASTFTIAGVDRTTTFTKGTRLKLTNSTLKYAIVASSVFSTNTTVTIAVNSDYALANATISSPSYSYQVCPQGYPTWFNFVTTHTGFSAAPTYTFNYKIDGNSITINYEGLYAPGTSNATSYSITVPVAATQTEVGMHLFKDNSAYSTQAGSAFFLSGTTLSLYKDAAQTTWTGSGTKGAHLSGFIYKF